MTAMLVYCSHPKSQPKIFNASKAEMYLQPDNTVKLKPKKGKNPTSAMYKFNMKGKMCMMELTGVPEECFKGQRKTQNNFRPSQQTVLPKICKGWQKTLPEFNHQHTVLPPIHRSQSKKSSQHAAQQQQGLKRCKTYPKDSFDSKDKQKANKMTTTKRKVMSPETVLRDYKPYLSEYELEEIKDYKQVWYLDNKTHKTHFTKFPDMKSLNSGFDTPNGYYKAIISDHMAYRFEILEVIGTGYSGQVLKCKDHKSIELVAIKVIRSKESIHNLGKAELKILEALREIDKSNTANIVHVKEHFYFRNHLCITFELFVKDLYKALKETYQRGFSEKEVRQYTADVLKCLQTLRKKRIIHGDLKPDNILLYTKDNEKHVAVSDFGGSYFMKFRDQPLTHTLCYASPEILLGKRCSPATDMWSLGCMTAELYLGHRLFRGQDDEDHFNCIMKVLGVPPAELMLDAPKSGNFFDSEGIPLNYMATYKGSSLAKHLYFKSASFLDFITHCLEYDPKKRMTPEEALLHPWIRKFEKTKPVVSTRKPRSVAPMPFGSKELTLLYRPKLQPLRLPPIKKISAKRGEN